MRTFDYLMAMEGICNTMARNDIDPRDVCNLDLYKDWVRMRDEGHKYQFIVYYLSTQYGKSESSILRIVKRLEKEIEL